ncbi:MAG: SPOR domain-containing protein [Alphaproteobacteria bacterium]|nr:SPOR domain-containing protein [Alphaproteobacteria bacterium]
MADNPISNARRQAETDPKDDDPFAELARIVGFEDDKDKAGENDTASEPVSSEPLVNEPLSAGTDTGLDLEGELLRELEIETPDETGAPVEQAALPESSFGVTPEPDVSEQLSSGPSFFDTPFDASTESPSEPADEPAFLQMEAKPDAIAQDAVADVSPPVASPDIASAGAWPSAKTTPAGSSAASLEAELQAAFSALEESGPAPTLDNRPSLTPEPVLPAEPIKESEEMASAYKAFEENIEAAIPEATSPDVSMPEATMPNVASDDDLTADVNDLLLAEMIDVEAEAAEAAAGPRDVPFDPSSIAEADDIPEAMVDLDVPQLEPEEQVPAAPAEPEFGLPLEEELDALASEASDMRNEFNQSEPYQYSTGPEEDLDSELIGIDDDFDIMADTDQAGLLADDDLDEYSEESIEDYDDVPIDDEEFAIDDDDLSVPEYDAVVESGNDHSNRRGLIAAAAVVGVLVVGGAGFYLWNSSLGGDTGAGGPRVIAADNEPVKVKPDSPGGKTVPNQDLAVYDRVAGTDSDTPSEQNLVNTTEEPVDVVQRTLDPDTLPLEGRANNGENSVKAEDRLAASDGTETGNGATVAETNGISPRKVRTLVVRPDGTIVARETPAEPTVTSETNTAANVGSDTGSSSSNGDAATGDGAPRTVALAPANSTSSAANPTPVTAAPEADSTQVASTSTDQTSGSSTVTGEDAALPPIESDLRNTGVVPVPGSKPGGQTANTQSVASTATETAQPAASAPVPSARPAQQPVEVVEAVNDQGNLAGSAPTNNPGGWVMQISSQPTEAGAQESYRNLSRRYASIIGGRGVSIQRANITNRGIFYRVRIPAGSKAQATQLCNQYKAAGGSCFVAR